MRILLYLVYYAIITQILAMESFNSTEVAQCKAISPKTEKDCLSANYSSLICCYFNMSIPGTGNVCVPVDYTSAGMKGDVNTVLPPNITLTGYYSCKGGMLRINAAVIIVILLLWTSI
jgi:hypothetical protein